MCMPRYSVVTLSLRLVEQHSRSADSNTNSRSRWQLIFSKENPSADFGGIPSCSTCGECAWLPSRKGYGAMMRAPPLSLPSAVWGSWHGMFWNQVSGLIRAQREVLPRSSQFGFPAAWLTSRSSCNDVARRRLVANSVLSMFDFHQARNLAPTLERFPALKTTGVRRDLTACVTLQHSLRTRSRSCVIPC